MDEKTEVGLAEHHGETAAAIRHHSRDNSRDMSHDNLQDIRAFSEEHNRTSSLNSQDLDSVNAAFRRNKRPVTPTTLGLGAWNISPSSSPSNNNSSTAVNTAGITANVRVSRSITPRPMMEQQLSGDYMRTPPWAPSPGPSLRISSLYDGPSDFPSSSTSLRSSRVGSFVRPFLLSPPALFCLRPARLSC